MGDVFKSQRQRHRKTVASTEKNSRMQNRMIENEIHTTVTMFCAADDALSAWRRSLHSHAHPGLNSLTTRYPILPRLYGAPCTSLRRRTSEQKTGTA